MAGALATIALVSRNELASSTRKPKGSLSLGSEI
jgi:hypothetical protein